MNKRLILAVTLLLILVVGAALRFAVAREAAAAPDRPAGFASPINAGCYIAADNSCKIHIDPFTINIDENAGATLQLFTLYANDNPIYDFRTDVSNPPRVDYSPSPVMLDFAAQCGETYSVNLVAKDTSDLEPLTYGSTAEFTCPKVVP